MIVKFILIANPEWRIIFGEKDCGSDDENDYHYRIADAHNIPHDNVRGGGFANTETQQIYGKSERFKKYNPRIVKQLLPDWKIEGIDN